MDRTLVLLCTPDPNFQKLLAEALLAEDPRPKSCLRWLILIGRRAVKQSGVFRSTFIVGSRGTRKF